MEYKNQELIEEFMYTNLLNKLLEKKIIFKEEKNPSNFTYFLIHNPLFENLNLSIYFSYREFTFYIGNYFHTHFDEFCIESVNSIIEEMDNLLNLILDFINEKILLEVTFNKANKPIKSKLLYLAETNNSINYPNVGIISSLFNWRKKHLKKIFSWRMSHEITGSTSYN